jgi:hypothetical protein
MTEAFVLVFYLKLPIFSWHSRTLLDIAERIKFNKDNLALLFKYIQEKNVMFVA